MIARACCWLKGHAPMFRPHVIEIKHNGLGATVNICDRCGCIYAKIDRQTRTQLDLSYCIGFIRTLAAAPSVALFGLWMVLTSQDKGDTATVCAGSLLSLLALVMAYMTDRVDEKEIDDKTASS